MTIHTVNDAPLHSAMAEDYYSRADRRVKTGMRTTLELLGIPLPEYAIRRSPARDMLKAVQADHPWTPSHKLPPRKANASPEAVAASRQRRSH